ncbi:radical SAM protein [Rhizohabitans arisaemae]|uniref:radical SAM protein n=1 Tax=Rhizohabitans arisaemae TaxID=2720610 RepID=UPI0024B24323|nr:radical SAM protein [Rhizohabitans arisaemae]
MTTALGALFDRPRESRERIITAMRHRLFPLPDRGSSFFIHLSELCPVACEHCMYSSDLNRKSTKDSLSPDELDAAIGFIDESRSEKLNITGGGEPFLKFRSVLRLLERVNVPRIEIVTAGYWGTSEKRTERLLRRMDEALLRNPYRPVAMLRLSIDRYHIDAPRPVRIEHYGTITRVWRRLSPGFGLGFRSIQPDMDVVDKALAAELGATIEPVNEWNRSVVMDDGRVLPITFNVFRLSGKAAALRDDLSAESQTIKEYYAPYESGSNRLTLATKVNDAIRGTYAASTGVAVTMDSDGTFWIFGGTAPDRRLTFNGQSFTAAMTHFFADPITHLLVEEGLWYLADLVDILDPATHAAALGKNDVAALVEDLLAPEDVRLAVTLLAARWAVARGRVSFPGDLWIQEIAEGTDDLAARCATAIREGRRHGTAA